MLCEELSEVNFNARGWAGTQLVWGFLFFGIFVFNQLLLDHLDLAALFLGLDPQLFFLSGREILLEKIIVMRIAPKDSLVVHDVEGFALVDLIIIGRGVVSGVPELLLAFDDLRLGALKCLTHF